MSEKERNEHLLGRWPRKCRNCGKSFFANDDWAYQIKKGPKDRKFFCRYNCKRAYEKEEEERKSDRALGKKHSKWEG